MPWLIVTREGRGPLSTAAADGFCIYENLVDGKMPAAGASVDAFNDIDRPDAVAIETRQLSVADRSDFAVDCPARSVSLLNLE